MKLAKKIGTLGMLLATTLVLAGCGDKTADRIDSSKTEDQPANSQAQLDDVSGDVVDNAGQSDTVPAGQLENLSKELDGMANSASQLDETLTLE